jgi:hypothetical protein
MPNPAIQKTVRVRLETPTDLPTLYSTNFIVQHTGHEFILTFYEARPPAIMGSEDEQAAIIAKMDEVAAQPLARVVIAASRMEEFLKVLRENFDTYQLAAKMEVGR